MSTGVISEKESDKVEEMGHKISIVTSYYVASVPFGFVFLKRRTKFKEGKNTNTHWIHH